MKERNKQIITNSIFSTLIGLVIGVINIISPIFSTHVLYVLISHSLIGLLIGSFIFSMFHLNFLKVNIYLMFVISFLVIAILPTFVFVIENIVFGVAADVTKLVILISVAEVLGLGLTFISYRNCIKINEKLENKKRSIG